MKFFLMLIQRVIYCKEKIEQILENSSSSAWDKIRGKEQILMRFFNIIFLEKLDFNRSNFAQETIAKIGSQK